MTRIGQNPDYYRLFVGQKSDGRQGHFGPQGAKRSGKSLMDKYTTRASIFTSVWLRFHATDIGWASRRLLSFFGGPHGEAISTANRMRSGTVSLFLRQPLSEDRGRGRLRAGSSRFRKGASLRRFPSAGLDGSSPKGVHAGGGLVDFLKSAARSVCWAMSFGAQYLYEWYYQKQSGPTSDLRAWEAVRRGSGTGNTCRTKPRCNAPGNPDTHREKRRELSVGFDAQVVPASGCTFRRPISLEKRDHHHLDDGRLQHRILFGVCTQCRNLRKPQRQPATGRQAAFRFSGAQAQFRLFGRRQLRFPQDRRNTCATANPIRMPTRP